MSFALYLTEAWVGAEFDPALLTRLAPEERPQLVVCGTQDSAVLEAAYRVGIQTMSYDTSAQDLFEVTCELIAHEMKRQSIDFLLVWGDIMALPLPERILFEGRIHALHPSLLPAFFNDDPLQSAWECGVKVWGATWYLPTRELALGEILDQKACEGKLDSFCTFRTAAVEALAHLFSSACSYLAHNGVA